PGLNPTTSSIRARRNGETSKTRPRCGSRPIAASMYSVLSDTELRHDTSCINPAGIQTARCGGTTEVDFSVRTDMTPEQAYRICVRACECIGSTNPDGYSSLNAMTGRAIPSKSALCFMA